MSNISQKLTYLNGTKQKIKDGINALGGELTNQSTFRSYANVLNDLYEVFPKVESEETTSAITLSPTQKAKMKLTLKGNIEQDGEPTPTNPQDIHIVSGDNTIEICGKNLFDLDNLTNAYLNSSGVPVSANNNVLSDYIPITSNQDYIISVNQQVEALGYALYDKDKTFISRVNTYSIQTKTLNSSTASYIRIYVNKNAQTFNTNSLVNLQPQLEKGSTATTYEPYTEQSYLISLGDIELCKIGEYEDEFFKNTIDSEYYDSTLELDKWYLKKRIGKKVLDGSENWSGSSFGEYFRTYISISDILVPSANSINLYSNYFYGSLNALNSSNAQIGMMAQFRETTNVYFIGNASDVGDFKNWLSTHNTQVDYVLATPENILLNDTLQETLDSFVSYQEQTNISQSNFDLPFKIKATALKDFSSLVN